MCSLPWCPVWHLLQVVQRYRCMSWMALSSLVVFYDPWKLFYKWLVAWKFKGELLKSLFFLRAHFSSIGVLRNEFVVKLSMISPFTHRMVDEMPALPDIHWSQVAGFQQPIETCLHSVLAEFQKTYVQLVISLSVFDFDSPHHSIIITVELCYLKHVLFELS